MMNKQLRPLMLVGTGSDVGKSVLATAFCRIFKQEGYSPAPFKAQNMALNSYATPDGLEIGRAQAVQAEAAGVPCETDMNPLLLKPNSEHTTQVVLNGRPVGNRSAYEYFRREGRDELRKAVCDAFDRLSCKYNPIVMEGAGSVSELNLRDTDLVNMSMARHADADVILVADIDRGGVFASAYGSIMLQTPEDRQRIKGIIINKFRGDLRLFDEGRKLMEEICGVPVLGVVPMFNNIVIEEEDSVELAQKRRSMEEGKVNVAVVLLRHISNFTDFGVLERDMRVNLFYTNNTDDIEKADIVILPGTKATLDDLYELRRNGVAQSIIRAHSKGALVMGICGGYQMLGQTVSDPDGVEGSIPQLPGLGLLPIHTRMQGDKVTRQVEFAFHDGTLWSDCTLQGYEIHQGESIIADSEAAYTPLCRLSDGTYEGCRSGNNCIGTYIHGILDNPQLIDWMIRGKLVGAQCVASGAVRPKPTLQSHKSFKEQQYDLLADHVRKYVDVEKIMKIIRL